MIGSISGSLIDVCYVGCCLLFAHYLCTVIVMNCHSLVWCCGCLSYIVGNVNCFTMAVMRFKRIQCRRRDVTRDAIHGDEQMEGA